MSPASSTRSTLTVSLRSRSASRIYRRVTMETALRRLPQARALAAQLQRFQMELTPSTEEDAPAPPSEPASPDQKTDSPQLHKADPSDLT